MSTPQTGRLSRRTKLLYGAGDIGFSLTDTTIGVLFAIFLVDVVGLSPAQAALAIFIGKSWDYVNDPLLGYISDRTRTRWGRRRPFLLFGFLPFGIAFSMLWWVPPIDSSQGLVAYYTIAYLVFEAAATLVYMPYFALTPELSQDYDERTSLTSYRMGFSILGGLLAFTIPLMIIGTMRPENSDRVFLVGAMFGAFSALPLLLTFFGTEERTEYATQALPDLRESIRAATRNRPFLFAMGIFLFTWTAIEVVQGMLLFFLKYRMNLEAESDYVAGTVFIAALLTLPIWVVVSERYDKRRAYIAGMVFLAAVLTILILVDPSWGLSIVLLLAALAGVGVAAVHVLPWSMNPDAVEVDELETGERHEGMFYALVTLFRKIATSIALPLVLMVLDRSGYVSNAASQSPAAILAIRLLMGPVPAVFLFGGILFALVYPLSRERHAEIRAQIAARS